MLDGPSAIEQQPQVAVVEVKAFSPDHKLSTEETGQEADRLIERFVQLAKNEPDVMGFFYKGKGLYAVGGGAIEGADIFGNFLHVQRQEGDEIEYLNMHGSTETGVMGGPKIEYKLKRNNNLVHDFAGDGITIDAARTLLDKTQKDFQSLSPQSTA